MISYNDLPEWEQELIDEVRVIMGDIDTDAADQYFTEDQWAVILQTAIRDFNRTRPTTDFDIDGFPEVYSGVIALGLFYFAALSRSNHLIEDLPVQGYAGPYVDTSVLSQRWGSRAAEVFPLWKRTRNRAKLEFLPAPAATIDQYNWHGRNAAPVIPILRSLPSWGYSR